MTGYTVHTGSTEKFSEGWDQIFGGSKKKSSKKPAPSSTAAKSNKQSTSARPKTAGKRSQGK